MGHIQKPLTIGAFIIILLCLSMAYGTRTGYKEQEWTEITDRLQQQIDECRRDTRSYTMLERRVDDLEAEVLFLREQLGLLEDGERGRAALQWGFEMGVGSE